MYSNHNSGTRETKHTSYFKPIETSSNEKMEKRAKDFLEIKTILENYIKILEIVPNNINPVVFNSLSRKEKDFYIMSRVLGFNERILRRILYYSKRSISRHRKQISEKIKFYPAR
jgi:hypothetical protein